MRNRAPWLAVPALLVLCAAARAQGRDAVEWLPAQTLACVELRHPERLAREVAALVKGSAVDDLPRRMARLREPGNAMMDWRIRSQLTSLSMFLSPEMIDEGGRIRGGFVALTGFAADGTPQVVGVLQTGSSNFPNLFMRIYLLESRTRLAGEVEGVPLYRDRTQVMRAAPGGGQRWEESENGPILAQLPGALVMGNSVEAVSDVVRRARGKSTEASLTSLRAFKEAATLRGRPGLFTYVDMAALQAQLDEQTRKPGHALGRIWGILKTTLGDEAVRNLTASLALENGRLEWQAKANLGGKANGPLFGLMPDRAAPRDLLHFAPSDALLAMSCGLGDGEKRWKTFVALIDALDKLDGRGETNRPSDALREMEEKVGLQIGKEILEPVTAAALVVDSGPKGEEPLPFLVLQAATPEQAKKLEVTGLPKLLGLANGQVQVPTEKDVDGQRIRSVTGILRGRKPLSYGRHGAVIVLGPIPERVARALAAGAKKEGLLADENVAAALGGVDAEAVVVGVLSPSRTTAELLQLMGRPVAPAMKMAAPPGAAVPPPPAPRKVPANATPAKAVRELRQGNAPMPPLVWSLSRRPDALVLEARQTGLRRAVPVLLDAWVDSILEGMGQGAGRGGAGVKTPAAAPPRKQ